MFLLFQEPTTATEEMEFMNSEITVSVQNSLACLSISLDDDTDLSMEDAEAEEEQEILTGELNRLSIQPELISPVVLPLTTIDAFGNEFWSLSLNLESIGDDDEEEEEISEALSSLSVVVEETMEMEID